MNEILRHVKHAPDCNCTRCYFVGEQWRVSPRNRRLVVIESPYAGDVEANIEFARACINDSLLRGEAPIASHLLFTQPGVLDDTDPMQRTLGINAGLAWQRVADLVAVYTDRGISKGMAAAIEHARSVRTAVEFRRLEREFRK